MLTVKGITKKYGSVLALDDISLEFEHGIYGILAPNGAGKTTLIKMLATLIFPTDGEILYNGTDIAALDEQYRDILGYLPQEFGYYRNYTPRQYLEYLAALKGVKNPGRKIDELLKAVSLSDAADKKMKGFSGGMVQKTGIAQALLNDPEILIFDEPTSGLDPKERARFRNIISGFAEDRTVILSTHIVSDIEGIADYIIMLKDHKPLYCLPPAEICALTGTSDLEEAFMKIYDEEAESA